jgi:acyl-CoA synthetase (NDP forming)
MLEAFFAPRSVAVIGASRDETKLGFAVLRNLVVGGYPGRIFPINPKAGELLGLPAFPSVTAVPEPIDLAVVVIPYPLVPAALEECGCKQVPAAIVISAGFREAAARRGPRARSHPHRPRLPHPPDRPHRLG